MTNYFNDLAKRLVSLGRKRELSNVFNDLLTLGLCAFHRTNIQTGGLSKDEDNEALYFQTIKSYDKEDLTQLSECLGILQLNVLQAPYSDPLGDFYMEHITKGHNGQYFTPEPICTMLAEMNGIGDCHSKRILDPACGSGRMLLSAAALNHENYFFGNDNNHTCAKMAALNCFLNGLIGEIAWMNSLTMEWYSGWAINQNGLGIQPIDKENSSIWTKAPDIKKEIKQKSKQNHDPPKPNQLTLF